MLCDDNPEIGGSLTYERCDPGLLADLERKLEALANLRLLLSTVCNGWYEDNWLPLIRGNTLIRTRARQVIFATGAITGIHPIGPEQHCRVEVRGGQSVELRTVDARTLLRR
mgnify:CR=1 FL=1